MTSACDRAGEGPKKNQTIKVSRAAAITAGTNQAVTWSTSAWMGNRAPWADSTMRMMRASIVSAPVWVTRSVKLPEVFRVPPVACMPGCFSTGTGSPVSMDSSTYELPSMTSPSSGIFSPGRTSTMSPVLTFSISTSTAWPSRITRAVRGCKPIRRLMAAPVLPLARASNVRPSKIKVTMTAAASK
ncbi:hypothetical protein D3C78_1430270 [compost metagenome]